MNDIADASAAAYNPREYPLERSPVGSRSRAPGPEEDTRIDFAALWRVWWEYKYLIGASTLLFGLLAVYLALTSVPIFRAEITVAEVTTQGLGGAGQLASQLGGIASLVGVNLGSAGNSTREADGLLKSRHLIEEFVKRHGGMPELYAHSKKPPTLWRTVRSFKNDVLSIRDDKRTGLTIIAINWTDPAVAARWANEFVVLANDLMRTRAMEEARTSVTYLEKQIELTNSVDLKKVFYNLVENETKTLVLANSKSEYAFAVVDPAVAPEEKFGPHRVLMTLVGLALGGVIGTLIALAHNARRASRRQVP